MFHRGNNLVLYNLQYDINMPYYFLIVDDPDGNEIEITGKYYSIN